MKLNFAKLLHECPECGSHSVRRSSRKGFVEKVVFRLSRIWPYWCQECGLRFFGYSASVHDKSQKKKDAS